LQFDSEFARPAPVARAIKLRPALITLCPPWTPIAAAAPASQPTEWGMFTARQSPIPRPPLTRGPLGAWLPPLATLAGAITATPAAGAAGAGGGTPADPAAAALLPPSAEGTLPNPSPGPAAKATADCASVAAEARTANIALPRS